jgi:eukaryotic-like serine/threonine-protein kinase
MSPLTHDQWQEVSPYLDEVLEIAPEQRSAWLLSLSKKDTRLASLIQALLDDQQQLKQEGFLETSALPHSAGLAGQKIGAYTLVSQIGQGGMGSVWLAQRSDGRFDRQAAVKFVNIALTSRVTEERFKREGTILGRLIHPHIAQLLDAGVSSDGRPYLVLEYVDGVTIDRYCDEHKLDVEARIRLFLDVLSPVAEAHANLVVHRDIKPSNVLVSNDGQVKLLDFGIAKLLAQDESAAETMLTMGADGPLTPLFAAPEQVTGGTVTTATDVYALGLMFYLLLTGQHPVGTSARSPAELLKAIVELEPPRASAVVLTAASGAEKRSTTPEKLSRQLRGDLDTILGKALKKNPQERYASVTAFADDLQRYLKHEAISVRPDTFAYLAIKFARRNRVGVALTSVALAAIVAGSAVAIYQARIAERRFQDVRKLAHTFVFDLHDEVAKLDGSTKVREMMVETGLQYLDNLAKNAGGDLELQKEIAAGYMKIGAAQGFPTQPNLGRTADAFASYRKAGDIYQRIAEKNSAYLPDLAAFYLSYSGLFRFNHDPKRARELTESAIQIFDRLRTHRQLDAQSENSYTLAWCKLGDFDEDWGYYHQAWTEFSRCSELAHAQLSRTRDPQSIKAVAESAERIGTAAQELGHLREALQAFDEEETAIRELLTAEPLNPRLRRNLALMYQFRGRVYFNDSYPNYGDPKSALESLTLYLKTAQEMLEHDPNNTAAQFSVEVATLKVSYCLQQSEPLAAVRLARDSLRMLDQMIASNKGGPMIVSNRAEALLRLGEAQLKAGQMGEALNSADSALAAIRKITTQSPDDRSNLVQALMLAGKTNDVAGNPARAESLLREARDEAQKGARFEEVATVIPLGTAEEALGNFYVHRRRNREAHSCYERLANLWQQIPESNEYVDAQKAASQRLLSSIG